MQVKVCGMRSLENIRAMKALPIDHMGFIFYKDSPRNAAGADGLSEALSDENWDSNIKRVGVFVDVEIDVVFHHVHDYSLDFVQLHGSESPEYCRTLLDLWGATSMRSAKLIKAFSIGDASDFEQVQAYETLCSLFIFDTKGKNKGGNGTKFDWSLLDNYQGIIPFLLSGGIDENAADAIRALRFPQLAGVDINSRFEIEAGLKDVPKVQQFVRELNRDF